MAGRPNTTWMATMIRKHGSHEGVIEMMREKGRIGGSARIPKGFGNPNIGQDGLTGRERARIAGAKGGRVSRRTKRVQYEKV